MSSLVIVESPTKARTIKRFLPNGFRVKASMGHIRDLPNSASEIPAKLKREPWAALGVNVAKAFEPMYVVPRDKKKVVTDLKKDLKDATEILLATDEDREGESISWHLIQALKPKVPVKRMVFHEITKEAIQEALRNCREIDENLVRAQEVRRILDRLVGYSLSPLLWKKIATGLSAGRVQSVSVRLLVDRERERRAFKAGTYWDLRARLRKDEAPFEAQLVSLRGKRLATGRDFDETTGRLAEGKDLLLLAEDEAQTLRDQLRSQSWTVDTVEEKRVTRKPAPPFITSTLQQEANRKLRMTAQEAMRVAQSLYEQGFITYMRTDSVHLSDQALRAARGCVEEMYGKDYLYPSPRQYKTKSRGAQEAHEAIRPAGSAFVLPKDTGLAGKELSLYSLIWKRTVATQMADAVQINVTAHLQVEEARFRASGRRIEFPGYFRAYVEGTDDPEAALEDREVPLPAMRSGDTVACDELEATEHQTQPPGRYTEATLIRTLEREGIGRPSTYATIIGTIIERGYAFRLKDTLVPSFTAFAVTALLENHFPDLVDNGFTARMEETLDEIARGEADWLPYLQAFYQGDKGLEKLVKDKETEIAPSDFRTIRFQDLDTNTRVRIGRYGPFLERAHEEEHETASLPQDLPPAELDSSQVDSIFLQRANANHEICVDPENGEPVFLLTGRYGPYVQLGDGKGGSRPKRTSLPKGMKETEVTEEIALGLLSLPRLLGRHPETGGEILAGMGRYGPFVVHDDPQHGKDYRSLDKSDSVLEIRLDRALEILGQPKRGRGRPTRSAKPLRELGAHPEDGAPVTLHDGPYGPYVKHGRVNASIGDRSPDGITLEEAIGLLREKRAAPKRKRARRG